MWGLKEVLGLDKVLKFAQTIKQVGGIRAALKQRYLMDQTRVGELVGEDKFGNKYYKDDSYFMPRNRWVVYSENVWLDYDATQVPPEWHGWLHHITDVPPTERPPVSKKWMMEHRENTSIYADGKYLPYSTVRAKMEAWQPDSQKKE